MKMSKFVLAFACLSLVAAGAFADTATGGLRYSITVTKFENKAGWSGQWDLGDAWGTVLTDLLSQSGKFIVLGEHDMRPPLVLREATKLPPHQRHQLRVLVDLLVNLHQQARFIQRRDVFS